MRSLQELSPAATPRPLMHTAPMPWTTGLPSCPAMTPLKAAGIIALQRLPAQHASSHAWMELEVRELQFQVYGSVAR